MGVRIKYGPHLFPNDPLNYIFCDNNLNRVDAHTEIIISLASAFSADISDSLFNQILVQDDDIENTVNISFMNYGNTELVYLVTLSDNSKYAALINQPHIDNKIVSTEYQNLKRLFDKDSRFIIEPHAIYENQKYSIYLTSYLDNALCIANSRADESKLGVYNPLPCYHFQDFNSLTSDYVNISRIAHLVNSYDERYELGIAKTQISGNDFMLAKKTNLDDLDSVVNNMKLIGARDSINVSFENYISMIKDEFKIATHRNDYLVKKGFFKINHHSRIPFSKEIIQEGIEQGMSLRKS